MKSLEQLADEGELFYAFESDLVKEQVYDLIKDASIANRVGRQLIEVVNQKAGHSLNFVLGTKDSMTMRLTAEGALIPTDTEDYSKIEVTPQKYAANVVVSQEMKEDSNWDVVKRNLREMGRQAGVKEDSIIFSALGDGSNGFASESGHDYSSAGTEISIADIVGAMEQVEENDYEPNVMVIHPEQVKELRQIDTFVEADKVGSRVAFEKGLVGRIFGMDVVKTTTVGASTSYVMDTRDSGVLVVRRPLTMKSYEIPERDALGVAVSMRVGARCLRPKAGVKITVS